MRIALFCVMVERTKHIHAQRSFRFLADRHKTFANGTRAKGLVGETTGHRDTAGSESGQDEANPVTVLLFEFLW